MSKVITCPSGLEGEIRTLTGAELKLFGNRKLAKAGRTMGDILKGCWLRTVAPGPYLRMKSGADGGLVMDWDQVLTGDLMHAFIEIRRLGWGDAYDFTFQCTDRECRKDHADTTGWSLSLADLKTRLLTAEARDVFIGSNRLPYRFGEVPVTYRLMTWADEREASARLTKYKDDDENLMLAGMAERLVEIDGQEVAVLERIAWLNEQPAPAITDFQEHLLATDPGPVTGIEVQCRFCQSILRIDLPFGETWFRRAKVKPTE